MLSDGDEERVMDADQWELEAQGIINDIQEHVSSIEICKSTDLQKNDQGIHFNLTTLEGSDFCVKLSMEGFTIVSKKHEDGNATYETVYALLNSISPKYRESFGNSLLNKLQHLKDNPT